MLEHEKEIDQLQGSLLRAIKNTENRNADESINWNFVQSDLYLDNRLHFNDKYSEDELVYNFDLAVNRHENATKSAIERKDYRFFETFNMKVAF